MVNEELLELLEGFVSESLDSLDDNEIRIEKLSRPDNEEDLKALFRVFHTLKGLAGFFDLSVIRQVTHEAETLFDIFRDRPHPLAAETIDLLYEAFDFLHSAIEAVGTERDDSRFAPQSRALLEKITERIAYYRNAPDETFDGSRAERKPMVNNERGAVSNPESEANDNESSHIQSLVAGLREGLAILNRNRGDANSTAPLAAALAAIAGDAQLAGETELQDIISSVALILESVSSNFIAPEEHILSIISGDIKIIIDNLHEKLAADKEYSEIAPAMLNPEPEPEEIGVEGAEPPKEEISAPGPAPVHNENGSARALNRKDVRVSADKLNRLFDLVGEIITAESMALNNPDLANLDLPNFSIAANMLNKLTRELQSITMSIRMAPVDGLFNKMTRLARDLSRKFDKEIDLVVYGEDTEIDKNVIEELSDPLVHIIRNSIDHGIESAGERRAAGKSEKGTVRLGASYQGNEIHIEISDDGAGLDRDRILKKAVERGLVRPGEELPDREVWQLVFEPGLSTAKEITDVSGRGVGMDVVKRNIEKLRGSIVIDSTSGVGTRITIRIPLTLAILDAMVVRVGKSRYALPILSIRESFRPSMKDITRTMDGVDMVKVRKDLYPVVRLHEIMRIRPDSEQLDKGILMMIGSRGKNVCLFVDEILDQQQAVVKPLSDYVGDVQGVTGCMVMSDGKVGLILDVESLIDKAEKFVN
ncbi:MAG: chemotaxis protein CheA [Chloroflexota bacterium]